MKLSSVLRQGCGHCVLPAMDATYIVAHNSEVLGTALVADLAVISANGGVEGRPIAGPRVGAEQALQSTEIKLIHLEALSVPQVRGYACLSAPSLEQVQTTEQLPSTI